MKDAIDFLDRIEGHGYGGMADYEIARTTVRDAADEIGRLRAALEGEWKQNHWEKCGHDDCVSFGGSKPCHHERPAPIAAYGQSPNEKGRPG